MTLTKALSGSRLAGAERSAGGIAALIHRSRQGYHLTRYVPGGVLLGMGIGVLVSRNDFVQSGSQEYAPILLLYVDLGFALITLLSLLFTTRHFWWPLLPAALLVALSVALLLGGTPLEVARVIGKVWPLGLMGSGLFLLWEWYRPGKKS